MPLLSKRPAAPSLEVVNMTMRFGAFTALEEASMKVRAGAFHALLGENGAGKSTLVKCVIGYQRPTFGDVLLDNKQVVFGSPRDAHAAGIGMVYQHFTLVQNMTVAENLVLVRDHVPAFIDWKAEQERSKGSWIRCRFEYRCRCRSPAWLRVRSKKLEILKQLYLGRKLLILDEPTSVLTPSEADEVLGLLHALTREQKLTVLIITHKFREVMAFCDEVSVLRRGKLVGLGKAQELGTAGTGWELMVGNETLRKAAQRSETPAKPAKLVIEKLNAVNDSGLPTLRGTSVSCVRARSSASPASRVTGRARWSKCSRAIAPIPEAKTKSMEPPTPPSAASYATRKSTCCPRYHWTTRVSPA